MWISKLTKDIIPNALAALCPCGRKLGSRLTSTSRFLSCERCSSNSGNAFSENEARGLGNGTKQRNEQAGSTSSSCCCPSSILTAKSFPLTGYLLYGTHPAFKSPSSSLLLFRKYKRIHPNFPLPRFLSCASWPEEEDQFVLGREKEKIYQKIKFNNSNIDKFTKFRGGRFYDMPSTTVELAQGTVTGSPAKRKLSTSPVKSPEKKKLLKQEEELITKKDAKMPSSVPSSPLKESTTSNLPCSPSKKLNLQAEVKSQQSKLQFAKLSEKAHVPTKGSQYAAGFDLKSAYEYTVPKRGSCLIKTDIQIKVPEGTYGRVAPRSGLALKNKIDVGAGVIDQDYRGNVGVILFNYSDEDFQVSAGDRVAQLICEKIEYPEIEEVKTLDETERGEGGFGSTGIKSQ